MNEEEELRKIRRALTWDFVVIVTALVFGTLLSCFGVLESHDLMYKGGIVCMLGALGYFGVALIMTEQMRDEFYEKLHEESKKHGENMGHKRMEGESEEICRR